mgnify:CR=1 FL=1
MTSSLNALNIAIGMAEKERDTAAGALARAEPEAAQAQAVSYTHLRAHET